MISDKERPEREELLKDIISDYEMKRRRQQQMRRKQVKSEKIAESSRRIVITAGICLMILLFIRAGMIAARVSVLKRTDYWALGRIRESDYKIRECVGALWQVRKAADRYYGVNKRFPRSAGEIYEKDFMKRPVVCPASGERYVLKELNGRKVFCCPNPESHGVSEIWCGLKSGPPVIERD